MNEQMEYLQQLLLNVVLWIPLFSLITAGLLTMAYRRVMKHKLRFKKAYLVSLYSAWLSLAPVLLGDAIKLRMYQEAAGETISLAGSIVVQVWLWSIMIKDRRGQPVGFAKAGMLLLLTTVIFFAIVIIAMVLFFAITALMPD